jgi:hypothetical protein
MNFVYNEYNTLYITNVYFRYFIHIKKQSYLTGLHQKGVPGDGFHIIYNIHSYISLHTYREIHIYVYTYIYTFIYIYLYTSLASIKKGCLEMVFISLITSTAKTFRSIASRTALRFKYVS